MAFCTNCGQQIDDKAVICVHCGASVHPMQNMDDKPSIGLRIVSFFIPIVGLILYLVKKDQTPISAKAYGKWALIGFIVAIVLNIIIFSITFITALFTYNLNF